MNEEATEILRQVIEKWKDLKQYTYEHKQVIAHTNPAVPGEGVLRFSNALCEFFCNGKNIEIYLSSPAFYTFGLSKTSESDNVNGDKVRLEKHLKDFDEAFYKAVDKKISDCVDSLTTSDPLFF